jgi:hypothetical protein
MASHTSDFDSHTLGLEEIKSSHEGLHKKFSDLVDFFRESQEDIHDKLEKLSDLVDSFKESQEDIHEKLDAILALLEEKKKPDQPQPHLLDSVEE